MKELVIEKIEDNEHFEYKGDVHVVGSIGKNATVIIKDGNLVVDKHVGDETQITLEQQSNKMMISGGSIFINGVTINGMSTSKSLTVEGNMGDSVTVTSHSAIFSISGSIGNNCLLKTHNGDITTGNVGVSSSLRTHNGDISCGNIGKSSSLTTHNGDVVAENMGDATSASSHNGDVRVKSSTKTTQLSTSNGNVYENGMKRKKEKSHYHGTTVFTSGKGISIINGRIIVNGKDITDLAEERDKKSSKEEEKPVRFKKNGGNVVNDVSEGNRFFIDEQEITEDVKKTNQTYQFK